VIGQVRSSGRGWGCGSSRQPLEAFSKLQDRAGIGQLPGHLPRSLGAVEPFHGFIQN
jgi:hypothetical protein